MVYAVNLRRIIRAIEKQDFEKAIEWLEEEIQDESVNPGAYLLYAQLLAEDSLSFYDLDRAREYIFIAVDQNDTASTEIKEDLAKVSIYPITFDNTYEEIKGKVFSRTLSLNTEEEYEKFMRLYPGSDEAYLATEKRDSIVFDRTKKIDTWQAYQDYFQTYPQSSYSPIAEVRYQRLVYRDKTRTNEPDDLERFLLEHPESPYREDAAMRLLRQKLITGDLGQYRQFVETYADTRAASRAFSILYHLNQEAIDDIGYPGRYNFLDSVRRVDSFNDETLFAFSDAGKVGLMTFIGEIFLDAQYQAILNENAFCQAIEEDVLSFQSDSGAVLTNRLGETFYKGNFVSAEVGSHGLVLLETDEMSVLLHKAGFILYEDIEDFHVINGKWVAIRRDGFYALASFAGKILTPFLYSDVKAYGEFVLFYNQQQEVSLYNNERLSRDLENNNLTTFYEYEEVERIGDSLLIGYTKSGQCLFNDDLQQLVACANHEIYINEGFFYSSSDQGYRIYDERLSRILGGHIFDELKITDEWIAARQDFWRVLNRQTGKVLKNQYDSIGFPAPQVVYAELKSQRELIYADGKTIALKDRQVRRLPGPQDSKGYLWIGDGRKASVLDPTGTRVLETRYEELSVIDEKLFAIRVSGKYGVMTADGKLLLSPSYDLIQKKGNQLYTLKYGKIGNVDLETGEIFSNSYEAAFEKKFSYYTTMKEGKVGLINESKEMVLDFDYQEIQVISDSLAWVKTDTTWVMLTLPGKKVRMDGITRFAPMGVDGYFKVYSARGFGIMTAEGQFLFNPVYSDIIVLQSEDSMLFRAENYFQEADYYIVVWYDTEGRKVYSNAYRSGDYEVLYCE